MGLPNDYYAMKREQIEQEVGQNAGAMWDLYDQAKLTGMSDELWDNDPFFKRYVELSEQYDKWIAERLISIHIALGDVAYPTLREPTLQESYGAQQMREMFGQPEPRTPFDYEMEDWQEIVSPQLGRVIYDYYTKDQELSYAANQQIKKIAGDLGISEELFLRLFGNSIGVP